MSDLRIPSPSEQDGGEAPSAENQNECDYISRVEAERLMQAAEEAAREACAVIAEHCDRYTMDHLHIAAEIRKSIGKPSALEAALAKARLEERERCMKAVESLYACPVDCSIVEMCVNAIRGGPAERQAAGKEQANG